jgi:hypothetical protein
VNNIPQDRSERRRGCGVWGNLVDHIVEVIRIELTSEVIRVSIKEGSYLPLKFVQVFTRPFNLEAGTRDIGHDVCSDSDRRAKPQDPEGRGNPRPRTGGLPSPLVRLISAVRSLISVRDPAVHLHPHLL